MIQD
jgi:hypothetical protein